MPSISSIYIIYLDNLDDDRNSVYFQWYSLALDIIEFKIFKPEISKAKRKVPTTICKMSFLNKRVEFINVHNIFDDSLVKAFLPTSIKFGDPTVLYSLTNPIRSKIFHFNKCVSNIDVKVFLQDNTIFPCNCAGTSFIDRDHQHLVTVDLQIIGNNKLRK